MGDCSSEDLCQTCLASGRRLFSINTLKCLLTESHFWDLVNNNAGVCWECASIIRKFSKLKVQAKHAQIVLENATAKGLPFVSFSRLTINTLNNQIDYHIDNETTSSICTNSTDTNPPMNTRLHLNPPINTRLESNSPINTRLDSNPPTNIEPESCRPIKEETSKTSEEFDVPFSNVYVADIRTKEEIKVDNDWIEAESSTTKAVSSFDRCSRKKARNFSCDECSLQLKNKNSLRCHVRRIHAVKREFVCEVCHRAFASKSRYESHSATHGGDVARQLAYCALCKIQYKNIYIYRLHLRTSASHQSDFVECPECKKRFANKTYYKRHYSFFHLKTSKFKCDQCDKMFISVSSLKSHNDIHHTASRERKFSCELCTKRFHTSSTLRKHQLIHSTARNYMCTHCGDTFKQNPALYTHIRLVHQGHKRARDKAK